VNREDIIRMAREAGGIDFTNNNAWGVTTWLGTGTPEFLERFAALAAEWGAKQEREACAKVCDGWLHANGDDCAAAIRARGEQEEPR